jgi:WD40 repeat protein
MRTTPNAASLLIDRAVTCFCINHDGTKGVSGSADNQVGVWSLDRSNGQLASIKTLSIKRPGISAIALRHDERIFATAGWDFKYVE